MSTDLARQYEQTHPRGAARRGEAAKVRESGREAAEALSAVLFQAAGHGRIRAPGGRALRAPPQHPGGDEEAPETTRTARPHPDARRLREVETRALAFDRRISRALPGAAQLAAQGAPGQDRNGRGQSAPRHFHREKIHQPRPLLPRPDPGRQHGPDESGGKIRVPPRLQIFHLRDLVDSAGDHPLDRRPGAHHPHPGAHDRDDQQADARAEAAAPGIRPRADSGRSGRGNSAARSIACAPS